GRPGGTEHPHRSILPSAEALAASDGDGAGGRDRPSAVHSSAAWLAMAWASREAGWWHLHLDAGYAREPGRLSAAQHPGRGGGFSLGTLGGDRLFVDRRGT